MSALLVAWGCLVAAQTPYVLRMTHQLGTRGTDFLTEASLPPPALPIRSGRPDMLVPWLAFCFSRLGGGRGKGGQRS